MQLTIGQKSYTGLAFSSVVDHSKLLKPHVQTSKICLLLLLNLLQICYKFTSATIYDRAECRSWSEKKAEARIGIFL